MFEDRVERIRRFQEGCAASEARFQAWTREQEEEAERQRRHPFLLQVGDRVRIDPKDQGERVAPDLVGQEVEIVGFPLFAVTPAMTWHECKRPGFYLQRERAYVRFRQMVRLVPALRLVLPEALWQTRFLEHREAFPPKVPVPHEFVMDLPEAPFAEGDLVRFAHAVSDPPKRLKAGTFPEDPGAFQISRMRFSKEWRARVDSPDVGPYFDLSHHLGVSCEGDCLSSELQLVARGNLWRRAHGEPLVFHDLAEEALFFLPEAASVRLQPPSWGIKAQHTTALEAIRRGEAHALRYSADMVDWSVEESWTAYRYPDADLGARLAKATLEEGFQIPGDERRG